MQKTNVPLIFKTKLDLSYITEQRDLNEYNTFNKSVITLSSGRLAHLTQPLKTASSTQILNCAILR